MKRKYISNYFSSGHLLRFVLYTTLVAFILGSCTERIDIKTDDEFRKLAVEGYISADIQVIRLTETSGYFSQEPPKPVPDAVVVVTEADETYQFSEDTENPGNYIPPENFPVELESSYHLTIDLEEKIGGESHFESDANMPTPSDQIDSIQLTYRSDFETWIVQLYAYEPPGLNYYMFTASVNDVPVTDSLSRVGVSDDRIVDGTYLYGIWVLFLNEDEVQVGDTVTLAKIITDI